MKVSKIDGQGNHLMLEGYGGDLDKLDNKDLIKNILKLLPTKLGLTNISEPLVVDHSAKNEIENGISGVILMAESHISIHTYPKKNFAVMDLFSCKEFDIEKMVNYVKNEFRFKKINKKLIIREYEKN
jgi:S-adenosylmethionine decarboxylase